MKTSVFILCYILLFPLFVFAQGQSNILTIPTGDLRYLKLIGDNDPIIGEIQFNDSIYGETTGCSTSTVFTINGVPGSIGGVDYDVDIFSEGTCASGKAVVFTVEEGPETSLVLICLGEELQQLSTAAFTALGFTYGVDNIRLCAVDISDLIETPNSYISMLIPSSDTCETLGFNLVGEDFPTPIIDDPEWYTFNEETCTYDFTGTLGTVPTSWPDPAVVSDSVPEYTWQITDSGDFITTGSISGEISCLSDRTDHDVYLCINKSGVNPIIEDYLGTNYLKLNTITNTLDLETKLVLPSSTAVQFRDNDTQIYSSDAGILTFKSENSESSYFDFGNTSGDNYNFHPIYVDNNPTLLHYSGKLFDASMFIPSGSNNETYTAFQFTSISDIRTYLDVFYHVGMKISLSNIGEGRMRGTYGLELNIVSDTGNIRESEYAYEPSQYDLELSGIMAATHNHGDCITNQVTNVAYTLMRENGSSLQAGVTNNLISYSSNIRLMSNLSGNKASTSVDFYAPSLQVYGNSYVESYAATLVASAPQFVSGTGYVEQYRGITINTGSNSGEGDGTKNFYGIIIKTQNDILNELIGIEVEDQSTSSASGDIYSIKVADDILTRTIHDDNNFDLIVQKAKTDYLALSAEDKIFGLEVYGYDPVEGDYDQSAAIRIIASDDHSENNTPGQIEFWVTPVGSDTSVKTMLITDQNVDVYGAINFGNLDDATLERVDAGDISIENNIIYRAGGTDIPVTDGGTGASALTDGGVLLGSGTNAITALAVLADGEIIVGDGTTAPVAESGATARASLGLTIGEHVQEYDAELTGIAGLTGTGLVAKTGEGTFVERTLVGDANEITVTNANGVEGNPSLSIELNKDLVAGTGLAGGGNNVLVGEDTDVTVSLSHLGLESLTDPDGDRIAFWDDTAGTFVWLTPNTSLVVDNTNLNVVLAENSVDSTNYTDGSIDYEHLAANIISGQTDVTAVSADYILLWDATDSTLKKADMGEILTPNRNFLPSAHNSYDVGETGTRWKNLWLSGNADIDGTLNIAASIRFGDGDSGIDESSDDTVAVITGGTTALGVTTANITFNRDFVTDRWDSNTTNTLIGVNVVGNDQLWSASNNTIYGYTAGYALSSGEDNTIIGSLAGQLLFTGSQNVIMGYRTANSVTLGNNNTYIGTYAARQAGTSGSSNTGVGHTCLNSITGSGNVAIGVSAGGSLTSSEYTITIGYGAGSDYTSGDLTDSDNSIYIGKSAKAKEDAVANEVVIGYDAIGNGTNTITLGNSSITDNYLTGDVHVGNQVLCESLETASDVAWDLGGYTAGAPTADGYLTVVVEGTTYRIAVDKQ